MTQEGVDFSSTASSDWAGLAAALKANGKHFAGRYAVNDLAPNGRGIGPDEYAAMTDAGIEIFLYWESSEGWMLNGETAGLSAAVNAQNNITRAGMPHDIPVYFACDIDATPEDQAQIDDCLRGCAKVLGLERVGIYGGFYVVERCFEHGTAAWFAQTSAWSGGQWFEGNHLEQYSYNHIIHGTNCDEVLALQLTYGQASKFTGSPVDPPPPPTTEPFPGFKHGLETGTDQHYVGITYQYIDRIMAVRRGRSAPGYDKPGGTKVLTRHEGDKMRSAFIADIGGKSYIWDRDGVVYTRSPFTPKLTLQPLP